MGCDIHTITEVRFDDIEKLKTLGKPEDVRVLMFFGN